MAGLFAGQAMACASGPVSVIVPYPAGGSMDAVTRVVAEGMRRASGRMFAVRNVGGASGAVGVRQALQAEPDGCTVVAGNVNALVLAPLLVPQTAYAADDLVPIGKVGRTDFVVIAAASLPVDRLAALPAHGRTLDRPLAAGHPGTETLQYFGLMAIERRLNIGLLQVPYRGSSLLVNDLIGGHIDIAVVAKPVALPLAQRGQVKILAQLDDTLAGDAVPEGWAAWFVARETPAAARQWLSQVLASSLAQPDVRQRLQELGNELPSAAEQGRFEADYAAETPRYRQRLQDTAARQAFAATRAPACDSANACATKR